MQVPSHVEYERATSVEHALALLGRPDHRVLAGGHSLIPMMKLRLAQPGVLVDINGLAELAYIKEQSGQLRIGALALAALRGRRARLVLRLWCGLVVWEVGPALVWCFVALLFLVLSFFLFFL